MNILPRQKLCEIVSSYGRSLCDEPRRVEALLRDLCGVHKREINVLINALKERVAADLLSSSQNRAPRKVLISRLARRLQDNHALSEDAALWAVESWALALGIVSSKELKTRDVFRSPPKKPNMQRIQSAPGGTTLSEPIHKAGLTPSYVSPTATESGHAALEQRSVEVSRQKVRHSKIAILLVCAAFVVGCIFTVFYFKRPEDKQILRAQYEKFISQLIPPSSEEIAQLRTLMTRAEKEWRQIMGRQDEPSIVDKGFKSNLTPAEKRANPKAQVWEYYKKAIHHAENMRNAYIEIQAAERAGSQAPKSTLRMYREHQAGLFGINDPLHDWCPFPETLAGMIQQWTASYEPARIQEGQHPKWLHDNE